MKDKEIEAFNRATGKPTPIRVAIDARRLRIKTTH